MVISNVYISSQDAKGAHCRTIVGATADRNTVSRYFNEVHSKCDFFLIYKTQVPAIRLKITFPYAPRYTTTGNIHKTWYKIS